MALPSSSSSEQRAAGLATAAAARRTRTELNDQLTRGATTVAQVLSDAATNDVIGNTRVVDVLAALPTIGKATARQIMTEVGIAPTRRLRSLSERQRHALLQKFDDTTT